MWGIVSTNIMVKSQHTKPYEIKMRSNKVEYSTAAGPYCKTYDFKVKFFMPYFSIRKIILHCFNIDNNEDC